MKKGSQLSLQICFLLAFTSCLFEAQIFARLVFYLEGDAYGWFSKYVADLWSGCKWQ